MKKYLIISFEGVSFPIAHKLQKEGNRVVVSQIEDKPSLSNGDKEEDKEVKRRRLSLYEGILDKQPIEKILKQAKGIKNKDEWFVWFDFNNLWKYASMFVKMGYRVGLFPTKEQYDFETDRDRAQDFIKKNYKGLSFVEKREFKKIEEAKRFLADSDKFWVLKGNNDLASTVVPKTEDSGQAREMLIGFLETQKKDYEKDGFVLVEKIINPIEITPAMVFWNGKPVFSDIDIETKHRDAWDIGKQVGCGTSLVVKSEINSELNKIAFPEVVYEMAKNQPGLFVWDLSILIEPSDGKMYPGEFCPNRFGYDSVFAELAMSGDDEGKKIATTFFDKIVKGEDPLRFKFGATLRLFNEHQSDMGMITEGDAVNVTPEAEPDVYLYEVRKGDEGLLSVGYSMDFGVVTGVSNASPEDAAKRMYHYRKGVSPDDLGYRGEKDFLSEDYPTAILKRFKYLKINA